MKENITKKCQRRQRLTLKSKLNGGNKVTAIDIWAVAIFRYGAGTIQWKASELKDQDRKSRKIITMCGGLHPRGNIDRKKKKKVKKKEISRGLVIVERCIREEANSLELCVAYFEENLIRGVSAAKVLIQERLYRVKNLRDRNQKKRKEKWSEKLMHGQFIRETMQKIDQEFKDWNCNIALCSTVADNQEKLYEVPHR